jgi:heavy metal sensor kinase
MQLRTVPSQRTFRRRLTLSMTLLAVGVLAVASTAIYLRVRQALLSHLDNTLLSLARTEVASALDAPGGRVHVHEAAPLLTAPVGLGYEKFSRIEDENRQVRAQTSNLVGGAALRTDPEREKRALQGQVSFADIRRDDQMLRGIYYPARDTADKPLVAVVAIPTEAVYRSLDLLLGSLVLALILGAAAAALGADQLARRLTQPLERIAVAADAISERNLQTRIPEVSRDVELRQVTRVLNDMLARLEAAFAAQRRFAADASHEMRSPLSNLRGTLEVALRQRRSADDYREALALALHESERLSRLVNDLLTLSRVDAKQFSLDVVPCDLCEIAESAVAAHLALSKERGVEVSLEAQPARVVGDAHRLREVADNLLDNALQHAPAGSRVVVRTCRQDGQAVLSVQDAGPGLSREHQAHVFERFYRVDGARARDSGGLGLGLPIARAIVEAHHGRIDLESEPGRGCRFSVRLPASGP